MLVLSFGANIVFSSQSTGDYETLKSPDLRLWKCSPETCCFVPAPLPLEASGSFAFYLNRNRIRLKGSEF